MPHLRVPVPFWSKFTPRHWLLISFCYLAIAAATYGALDLIRGERPIFVHVRWTENVDDAARQVAEARYSLSESERLEGRTWAYTLNDVSTKNIRALVSDPETEDTQDIDRTAFRPAATAVRRPYPPSPPLSWLSLWGATVICLIAGLTGATLTLVTRPFEPAAASRALPPTAAATPPLTALESTLVVFVAALMVASVVVVRTTELRVDEKNHLGQIRRYAAGDFATTSAASGGFHTTAAIFAWLTNSASKENVRLFAVLISVLTIFVFGSVAQAVDPQSSAMRTLQFSVFPLLFPFWFLIYTDVLALLLMLFAVRAVLRERFHAAGIAMALAITVRQTYVVWLAMLGVWTAVVNSGVGLRPLARRLSSFAIAAVLFLVIVVVNGGVAMADRDNHPDMQLRLENLLFMLVCFFLFFFPLVVSSLPKIARLRPSLLIGISTASMVLYFSTFRVDHPYNIVSPDFFLRNALLQAMTTSTVAGVAASLAIALALMTLMVIRLRQPIHDLIYPYAALAVLPVWLIEQRYYLPAFALFMVFRESASPAAERWQLAVSAVAALFLFTGVVRGNFFL